MLRRAPCRSFASRRHGLMDRLPKPGAKPPATTTKAPASGKDAKKDMSKAAAPPAEPPVAAPAVKPPRVVKPFEPRKLRVDLDKLDLRWLRPGPIAWTPSGYVKPLGKTEEIPFQFTRTASGFLPVYRQYRNQGNRILTEVRKYHGSITELERELRKIIQDAKYERRFGHIVVHGDWANEIKSWLFRLGF